jgi:hypothetical protein
MKMLKSDKLLNKFSAIEELLESARVRLQALPVDLVDQSVCVSLYDKIGEVIEDLEELTYESVGPIQADEDETQAKIERMEAELFQLRASLR